MERGRIQELPKFFEHPLLSQERIKLRSSNLAGIFTGSVRTKALLNFGRKWSMGVSRDCPNFSITPIISGTGKATNFKFYTHILSIDRNKSPLQNSGKVGGCVVRTFKTFQGTIYWAHRAVFFAIAQLSCLSFS